MRTIVVGAIVFALMLAEARRAWRNEREQRARGGIEAPHDVYRWMQLAYPGAFAAMLLEGLVRGPVSGRLFVAGAALFALAKTLKYWAIRSLGRFWTFRVIVVPGSTLVTTGPYRFVRHPNYVAVIGELVAVALMCGAAVAGPLGTIAFAALIARRIVVEDDAILTRPDARWNTHR